MPQLRANRDCTRCASDFALSTLIPSIKYPKDIRSRQGDTVRALRPHSQDQRALGINRKSQIGLRHADWSVIYAVALL